MKPSRTALSILLLATLLTLQGGHALRADDDGARGDAEIVIKVATVAPRIPEIARRAKMFNEKLAEETNGRVQFRTYWGGVAGDDQTVMRKLRTGQIDAAPIGIDVLTNYVRQAAVLNAPQTFFNYAQVDAVRKALSDEFGQEAYKNGIKVISWWDAGRVRIFSKEPIRSFADLKRGRPWLYPSSLLLKEFYKMIDVTGVPLELPEVYGGLQTGMIDTVWISPVLASILRWAQHTHYVSDTPVNVIQGAFVLRRPTWEALKDHERAAILEISSRQLVDTQRQLRTDDEKTYKRLLERGTVPVPFDNPAKWREVGAQLRSRMIGRTYTKDMLERVEAITTKLGS